MCIQRQRALRQTHLVVVVVFYPHVALSHRVVRPKRQTSYIHISFLLFPLHLSISLSSFRSPTSSLHVCLRGGQPTLPARRRVVGDLSVHAAHNHDCASAA
ncbi:hypothetical protein DFH08DRAFT_859590 [Mycena albidolilacea]|uniref:Uncharacterized protein n=1 Tax=Mycena albidolilacea TaxID=1033008 RepID=A0AAD7EWC8_9AGAR|nr:hypothetical protein DFH08DRAFT_859590 [Mycena albidolilacea]